MATITIEIGKKGKKKVRSVFFLVCHGKTKRRIPTEITVTDSELSANGKHVKEPGKAKKLEEMRRTLQDRIYDLSLELAGRDRDANYIVKRITSSGSELEFFSFTEDWLSHSQIKGKKNYHSMLSSLEGFLGSRTLYFSDITYQLLESYKESMSDKPRAQSLYLGQMRHLYREAMRKYNNDYEQVIKNDPFLRFRVPKQVIKKGVRALSLEDLLKIYHYEGKPGSRAQLARDCFILSFCLMGMNTIDMYQIKTIKGDIIPYNRSKTRDRRDDEAYIEVKVHPFIKPLMNKYKDSSHVFKFHRRYVNPEGFNTNVNKGLKVVGDAVGIQDLEFYQARHTFATLSRNFMKFSKSDVDEALNHVGTLDIADIYIAKDFSIINENNFKLINKVFRLKKSGPSSRTAPTN